ncbi:MAG: VOC family protein [Thermoleophilaceae bacterium]
MAFSIWQAGERNGAQLVNEPGAWAMSALHTPSSDRAKAFYGAVFGWRLEASPETPVALWRLPGYVGQDRSPPHWAINIRVDDIDGRGHHGHDVARHELRRVATTERAVSLGGTLILPPIDTPGFRSAVLADPQQGVIAISAPRHGT